MTGGPPNDFGMSSPAVRYAQDAMLLGTPDGQILHANPAACLMFGRSVDELRRDGGVALIDHVAPPFAAAWATRLAAGSFRGEMTCRRQDGSLFQAEVSAQAFMGDDGQPYTSISIRDISERKVAEAHLRESELRYRTLVETLDEGIVYQDADGAIIASNAAAERILGLTTDQMAGRTSLDPRWRAIHEDGTAFPGQDHPAMVSLRTGRLDAAIMGVHKPDNTLTWISIRSRPLLPPEGGAPEGVVATFTDITEQRAATAERERLTIDLAHRLRRHTVLLEVAEQLAGEANADQVRATLSRRATEISGAEECAFLRWNPDDRTLTTISSTTPDQPVGRVYGSSSSTQHFSIGIWAIEQLRPIVIEDYAAALADQPQAVGHRFGARAAAAVPLLHSGRVLGVFTAWSTQPGFTFNDRAIESLRLLGGLASAVFIGLERTQLETIAMSARALMHSVNNHLAIATGMLEVGLTGERLSTQDRAVLAEVNAQLDAAAEQIVQFARVSHIATVMTPAGTSLDIGASSSDA